MKIGRIVASLLSVILLCAPVSAGAQLFNPNTPVGPAPILPPTPPAATPGMNPQPPAVARDSRSDPLAAVPSIKLGTPSAETHNDRSIRCVQQGAALGVPAGAMGQYVGECVNSR
jgi:hypothetical protein